MLSNRVAVAGLAVGAAGTVLALCWKCFARALPVAADATSVAQIAELWVYPIKGAGGTSVPTAALSATGLKYDRTWVIVRDRDNKVIDLETKTILRTVTAKVVGDRLVVTCATGVPTSITVDIDYVEEAAPEVNVVENTIPAGCRSVGDVPAKWFSAILNEDVHLMKAVRLRAPHDIAKHQGTSCSATDRVALHAYSSLHVITTEGLAWLNGAMPPSDTPRERVDAGQLRANVVISGGKPFPDEDTWDTCALHPAAADPIGLRIAKNCGRCSIPTVHANGKLDPGFEPTATLRRERACVYPHQERNGYDKRKKEYMFGLDAFHDGTGALAVGDRVTVTSRREPPKFVRTPGSQ